MNILVTGSSGFIGSRLADRLRDEGHRVVPFDILSGNDMLDRNQVEQAVGDDIDIVYHIAAQADLTKIKAADDAYCAAELNITGTHNIAYACAKHRVWMVYASTVCVYGNQNTHPAYEDNSLPNPSELYAYTKWAGEQVVRGYGANFEMPYTILRFATIYGPGMRKALATHIFFDQAYRGAEITVHGTGEQDRTQTFVEDLVDGLVATHRHPESKGHIINLTASESVSANKMAEDIKRITGSSSPIVHVADRPRQTYHEAFSADKAKQLLGWTPRHSWEEGLRETAAWFEKSLGYQKRKKDTQ